MTGEANSSTRSTDNPRASKHECRVGNPGTPTTDPAHLLREVQYERRFFEVDVLECPECHGRMRILAAIHSLGAIRAILDCLGLPPRPPPIRPADPDPHRPDLYEAC